MNILVTGCSGLIGSAAVEAFDQAGDLVVGIDNNQRAEFFGPGGDTMGNLQRLQSTTRSFEYLDVDIRDSALLDQLFADYAFDVVIHCAAQPSHDKAAIIPKVDFDVNAVGTLNLLEATRKRAEEAVFLQMSTNKVYGDAPNEIPLKELATRWDYADPQFFDGIDETMRIDQSMHSLFGVSKAAGDLMAQEYGRYFGIKTGIFRGGCLTGPQHAGVELHGFLSYLVKCAVDRRVYRVFGYKGKQVRDQIHARDVVSAFQEFIGSPKVGAVYNLGGGRQNAASILETVSLIEDKTGQRLEIDYLDEPRKGDHICYITNMGKFREHFPAWRLEVSLSEIIDELLAAYG